MGEAHRVVGLGQYGQVGLGRLTMLAGAEQLAADRALRSQHQVDTSTGVWARVRELAAADPHRVAVTAGAETTTYQQLCRRVHQIQATLLSQQCGPGDRIGVVGPRSADTIAVFLAIESLGAAYLPVDVDWPVVRVVGMLQHAQPRCLILNDIDQSRPNPVIHAAKDHVAVIPIPASGPESASPLTPRVAPNDEPRYVIHTSGTTGRPKGVVVNQQGLMNHLWSMVATLRLTASDTVAFTASPTYVISMWQMLAVLLVGGSVAVIADSDMRFARHLMAKAASTEITVMELVPTVIGWIIHDVNHRKSVPVLPSLRCLISTGEKLDPGLAASVLCTLPHVELFNAYGSTECSDDVSLHLVTSSDVTASQLPAGVPIPNVVLYLLVNESGVWRAAEPGEIGELWVGGLAVSAGYLNDPEFTRDAFFVDEFDRDSCTGRLYRTGDIATFNNGLVYCLGRADRQVKVAGVRIELDEVEAVISRIPGVMQCAVVAERHGSKVQLAVYYVAESDFTQEDIFMRLRSFLPSAMLPHKWIRVENMPLNTNGKVDYTALLQSDIKAE
ncbi:amino acid adenylation domain-containing protein [Streptomyces wuyuanensis]|uniref:amino acid adenylation domain-containing protein n=1 Tax=Streptomyces wuyuanensis TaxID=1196353 RepID=UPI0037208AB9